MHSKPGSHHRSTREVFEDHLAKRKEGRVEEDIVQNYAQDVILLTGTGTYRGHEGVRKSAQELEYYLPAAKYNYNNTLVEGEVAFLEWSGHNQDGVVQDGADSFVIRNGKIVAQTIHYTVNDRSEEA